jgi:predicted cupin superfamily sugar epimerase
VTSSNFSKLHTLKCTEVYHYYAGDPLILFLIHEDGTPEKIILGNDILAEQVPQAVIKPGTWQGSYVEPGKNGYTLVGTTCSPGFVFEDFTLGEKNNLLKRFPEPASMIERLT